MNLNEAISVFCDKYCRYPLECRSQDELDEHCDNCDFIKIINLKEEKEKSEKAKLKLVACCKNSAEKIKNQREQLKSCNKKIEELMADIDFRKSLISRYEHQIAAKNSGVYVVANRVVKMIKEKAAYCSADGTELIILESDLNDVINDVVGEMDGGKNG